MHPISAALAAGAFAALLAMPSAEARTPGADRPEPGTSALPPVSGTIRLTPDAFGRSRAGHWRHRFASRFRRYGAFSGYQAGAYGQIWRGGYNRAGAETFWNRNVEFYGEGNDTLAMTVTGWGTADSATTGGAYPPPSPWHRASLSSALSAGGAGVWSGSRTGSYGYAPTGGLAYYNSGSPGGMAYYGSSSSRGPGGSPGGLGIYSSGSYGPGPKIIRVHDHQLDRWSERLNTGPHIIHVGRDGVADD